ncbi:MAG: hypothetical protein GY827_10995 [Cytophagales bacterium]|nr:hypothetical protein [Cytophagales bacterium]
MKGNREDKIAFITEYKERLHLLEQYKEEIINTCTVLSRHNEDNFNFSMIQVPSESRSHIEELCKKINHLPYGLQYGDVIPTKAQLRKLRNPFVTNSRIKSVIVLETSRYTTRLIEDPIQEIKDVCESRNLNPRVALDDYNYYKTPSKLYEITHYPRRKMKLISRDGFDIEISENNTIVLIYDEKIPLYQVQNRNINPVIELKIYHDGSKKYVWRKLDGVVNTLFYFKEYRKSYVEEREVLIKSYEEYFTKNIDNQINAWERAYGEYTFDAYNDTPPPF